MMEWIVTSTTMILIVIALRGLLKGKISLKLQYGLWALVLVRLLLPFSIVDSAISITNILSAPVIQNADEAVADYRENYEAVRQDYTQQGQEVTEDDIRLQVQQHLYDRAYSQIEKEYAQSGSAVTADRIHTEAQQQVQVISLTAVITEALPYFWVAGMIVVAFVLTGSNLHFWWKLRQNRKTLDIPGVPLKVYLTDYVATPCLFGMIKPDIYLTNEVLTDSQMRRHVLAHEMSHYRQGDHIWSVLRSLCLVLHWYNPLVWVAAELSKQDAELACDEATIKTLGETERTAYGRTLIGMTCVRRDPRSLMLTATTMLSTKKTLKERIALIAKKPKTALYTLIACVLVASLAVGCTFTGAPGEPDSKKDEIWEQVQSAVDACNNSRSLHMSSYTCSGDIHKIDFEETPKRFECWIYEDTYYSELNGEDGMMPNHLMRSGVLYDHVSDNEWLLFGDYEGEFYSYIDLPRNDNSVSDWTETDERLEVILESGDIATTVWLDNDGKLLLYATTDESLKQHFIYLYHDTPEQEISTKVESVVSRMEIVTVAPNPEDPTTEPTTEPTEPTEPPTTESTEPPAELDEVGKFQNLLTSQNGYWYWRAMGCIFEEPEDISLYYLFYNGLPYEERQNSSDFTDSEVAFLKDVAVNSSWQDESVWVNAHKMPRQYISDVLNDYFGLTLDDVTIPEEWSYFEETDSYYYIRSDGYGVNGFTVTDVQTDENGLIYVYWTVDKIMDTRSEEIKFMNEPQMVMVLEEREDGGYRIHLNLPVEELLDTTDEEYFQNLLRSQNGFWYWRALGCIFENPESIDMSLLCYGGMENRIHHSTFTDDEIEFLKSRYPANDFDDSPWSNAHKLPRQELEAVMQTYFGVSLDDVSIPWVYYEETDAYYHVKYDSYGIVGHTVTDVDYHDDGTISVYWHVPFGLWDTRDPENQTFLNDADMVLTLKDNGDGTYTVLSNLPV